MLICEVCMKRIQNAYKMYKVRARGRGRGAGVGVARAWAWRGRGRRLCVAHERWVWRAGMRVALVCTGCMRRARTRAYARIRVDVCTRSAAYACKRKRAVTKTARMVYVLTSRTYSLLLIFMFAFLLTCKRNSCYHAYTHTQKSCCMCCKRWI